MNLKIYLSGSIKKGTNDKAQKSYWTETDIAILRKILTPKYDLILLNPAVRNDDLSDYKSVLGRDLLQVFLSDLIVVDARDRKGLGIGSEMTFAKVNGIPVISVSPIDSQYNRRNINYLGQNIENWLHPFVGGLSDYVAESVEDAAEYILDFFPFNTETTKRMDYLYNAMQYYIDTQLVADKEMHDLISNDTIIRHRILSIKDYFT